MNKLIIPIIVVVIIAAGIGAYFVFQKPAPQPQTPVYVTFYSHNEEGDYWKELINDEEAYKKYRADLISKVKLLQQYGVKKWNWESDWAVLLAMQKHEQGDLLKETNGKNILRWMVEDMGVVVDPHGHLTKYNYADLAYLIEKMGVKPSSIIGGFAIYQCSATPGVFNQMDWMKQLEIDSNGIIKGRAFPNYTWKPKILGQPAMIGHAYDEFSSGVWRPSTSDFLKHDSNGKFIYVGQGYPHYKENIGGFNSGGSTIWYEKGGYIKELASMIKSGKLPQDEIYTASVSFRDNPGTFSGLEQTLKALKDLKESGQIIYADYESVAKIWQEEYNEKQNRVDIENFSVYNDLIEEVKKLCASVPSTPETPTDKCGDNICDNFEKANPNACPGDCQQTTPSPTQTPIDS